MDAEQRRLMGDIGSSWLTEDTTTVVDDKGNKYQVNSAALNTAFVNAGVPHQERGQYKQSSSERSAKALPPAVLAKVKKIGKKIEKPWSQADADKARKRQDKDFASDANSQRKAKDKLIDAIEKWADDAGADFEGDENDASDAAADMALSFLHQPGVAKMTTAAGMGTGQVKSIAADYFYDAVTKSLKKRPADEGIGGVPRGTHAIGSLATFSRIETAPWLPPFVLDAGDQPQNDPTEATKAVKAKAKKFAALFKSKK